MSILAPMMTLILGFLASWITLKPPTTRNSRGSWIGCFALLSVVAIVATYIGAREDAEQKSSNSVLITSIKNQTESFYSQNADLHNELNKLGATLAQSATALGQLGSGSTSSCRLKSDIQRELEQLNSFLKGRLAKSPAYDYKYANDPQYSQKEEAYEVETSRQYIEKFWPSIQSLLRQAQAMSITPEGTAALATPGWYPEPKWWEAMLKPGYKELVLISQQIQGC